MVHQPLLNRLAFSYLGDKFHDLVEVFCDNVDSSVTLPDVGTWVAVRVTAVFHPGHFWVQFPYGTKPIEERILAGKSYPTIFFHLFSYPLPNVFAFFLLLFSENGSWEW